MPQLVAKQFGLNSFLGVLMTTYGKEHNLVDAVKHGDKEGERMNSPLKKYLNSMLLPFSI